MSDIVERVEQAIFACHFADTAEAQAMMQKAWGRPSPLMDMVRNEARAAIASMQADAAPVAWMYERGPETIILQEQLHRDGVLRGATGWTETPLYAAPVDDRAALVAEISALQTAADKLAGYAGHDDDCEIMKHGVWTDSIPCTCGYTDAWWAYEAAKQASK